MSVKLALVLPCYNEELALGEASHQLLKKMGELIDNKAIAADSFILFVDDGSKDKTWCHIQELKKNNANIRGLKLSRNFGHQNALLSGLMYVKNHCDCAISMDADLQDDIDAIDEMLNSYANGSEVVYGVRSERDSDTVFKRGTAQVFYKLMQKLGVELHYNHADFRLTSARVLKDLNSYGEANLFLRGIFPLIGYQQEKIYYKRHKRIAGETKYPFKKMILFALNALTSFTIIPLRLISVLGFVFSLGSFVMIFYVFLSKFVFHNTIQGWASTLLPIYFLGGIQLLAMGVLGEYIGKIYQETKARPRFIVEKILD